MNKEEVNPVAIIGQYISDGKFMPAAKVLNETQDIAFDPVFVAGSLVCLYESFLSHVAENQQCEFEKIFTDTLYKILMSKEELVEKYSNDTSNQ